MNVDLGGAASGPLAGVKVLDLSTIVSGPLCAQVLGDFGADVIKVETPSGDTARILGLDMDAGISSLFAQYNRNKRSIVLNLKSEQARDALLRLAEGADVLLENFRAGVADRLGIGYEALRERNPGLIYLAINGFGPDGPYAEQPAYDMIIQGLSGFSKLLGDEQNPKLIRNLVADKTSGMTASYAVMAALFARERRGGAGQRIDVPMIDAFSSFVLPDAFAERTFGKPPTELVSAEKMYRAWPTKDGHVALIIIEDRHFEGLCRALEREDLIGDERFSNIVLRLMNADVLFEMLETELVKWKTAEIVGRAHRFQTPMGAVNGIEEFMEDPQVRSNRSVFELPYPGVGAIKLFRSAPRFSETPSNVRLVPPKLGEHTAEVLREAGFADQEIEALAS